MSYAVKGQIELVGDKMRPGDVYVTNHPGKLIQPRVPVRSKVTALLIHT